MVVLLLLVHGLNVAVIVFGSCEVMQYFVSFLICNHLAAEEIASCFTFVVFLLPYSCWCSVSHPRDVLQSVIHCVHARTQKNCQRGFNYDFLADEGRGSKCHYKQAIIGPPAKRHLNGVLLGCR